MNKIQITSLLFAVLLFSAGEAHAQYALRADVVGAGATDATGGTYTLRATVGQTAVGPVAGGTYTAAQGFWYAATSSGSPLALGVTIVPVSPPVTIPAGGGTFDFTITVSNPTASAMSFDLWIGIAGPTATHFLRAPRSMTLASGQAMMNTLTQGIVGTAAAGTYTYVASIGTFPGAVISTDNFTFEKASSLIATRTSEEGLSGRSVRMSGSSMPSSGRSVRTSTISVRKSDPSVGTTEESSSSEWQIDWDASEWQYFIISESGELVAAKEQSTQPADDAATSAAPVAAVVVTEAFPTEYALHAAYPNPIAEQATLRYELPEATHVRVVIYDLLGREVAWPVDADADAGRYTAALDARELASGIYVVRMLAGERSFTQRVTVLR